MPFRSKGGSTAVTLRLREGETKNAGIKRLSANGWIFPDEWNEISTGKDAISEYLIMPDDAENITSTGDQKAKAGRFHGQKDLDGDGFRKYVKKVNDDEDARVRVAKHREFSEDMKNKFRRPNRRSLTSHDNEDVQEEETKNVGEE